MERLLDQVQQKKALSILDGGGPGFMRGDGSGASFGTGMSPGRSVRRVRGLQERAGSERPRPCVDDGEIDTGAWAFGTKGTLLEGAGNPGSGTGGGWVPAPQVVPGMTQKLFQPLRFEDLLQARQATTSVVRYASKAPPRVRQPAWPRVA